MMRPHVLCILLSMSAAASGAPASDQDLYDRMERARFHDAIRAKGEGVLTDPSSALREADIRARFQSGYSLELRPSISDDDAGLALRVYLPDRWSRQRLKEQLLLASRAEQLRIAALEWQDIVAVYRDFCTYRKLKRQLALTAKELDFIEPYLKAADLGVDRNQLALNDRARLYGNYLALLNDHHGLQQALLEVEERIKLVLGPRMALETLAKSTVVSMPSQMEIESLLHQALEQRTDYRLLEVDLRAMQLAKTSAEQQEGFRFKFIQPQYRINHEDGTDGWELSAAFVLPWGTRNPDVAVYRQRQALWLAARDQQRSIIEDRLRVMLDMANAYYSQHAEQKRRTQPVLDRLQADLEQMDEVPLEQIRDILAVRERMLDASLQSTEMEYTMETIAIDLAEELGCMYRGQ